MTYFCVYIFIIVLVQNLLEFEGVLGRESFYYPHRSTHKSIYLKFRKLLDYNYEDWEPTTPLYLHDFDQTNNSTNNVSKITTVTESVVRTEPNVTITDDTVPFINTTLPKDNITANKTITVEEDNLTTTKIVSNTTSKETVVENTAKENLTDVVTSFDVTNVTDMIPDIIATNISVANVTTSTGLNETDDTLKELVSTTSSPVTTIVSPPTIEKYSPWTFSDSGTPHGLEISTPNPILEEINELHRKDGYFTASLIMLLHILLTLEGTSKRTLLGTLKFEVERRDRDNVLPIFGGKPAEVFLAAIQMLAPEPLDVMQSHLSFVEYALENRNSVFNEDVNKLLNIIDTVFTQTDAEDIATVLADLKSFPNSSTPKVLIDGLLKTFVSEPFGRLQGTEQEKLMIVQINDIINNRFGEHIFNRRLGLRGYESTSHSFDEESNSRRYQIRITNGPILSTSRVEFMEDWSYVTNATIIEDVKHRMNIYKNKFKRIKKNKKEKFRGPTTTTTSTTTTIRSTMHKSNYYIRRYVTRNLYRMKTTTKKTTRFRYRYYGKIRKFNIEYSRRNDPRRNDPRSNGHKNNDPRSNDPRSDSEGYYSDENIESTESAISLEDSGGKAKETTQLFIFNNNNGGATTANAITDSTNERNVRRLDIDDSDPELKFKLNLKDAMIHGDFKVHKRF